MPSVGSFYLITNPSCVIPVFTQEEAREDQHSLGVSH